MARHIASRMTNSLGILLVIACSSYGTAGTGTGEALVSKRCPHSTGICLALVANTCKQDGGVHVCQARGLDALGEIIAIPSPKGVPDRSAQQRIAIDEDGWVAAKLSAGTYRLRSTRQRSFGFDIHVAEGSVVTLNTRSAGGSAVLAGRVGIRVSGGAEGNSAVSYGGPGAFLLISVIPLSSDGKLDRKSARILMTDAQGAFEVALPAGRYYVSDLSEADDSAHRRFGTNETPVMGKAVEVLAGKRIKVDLAASEAAP